MPEFQRILYEQPAHHVVRIVLNRPEARNAQDPAMLYEINHAFDTAARDDDIKVIILAANGPHFSSGHDFSMNNSRDISEYQTVGTWCGFTCAGAEGLMGYEKEMFLGLSERWRTIPKPTIAEVQGKVITGGLLLVWPCDLIIAADNAMFQDNALLMGVSGAELFNHPYEFGVRKAKEMLFRSSWISAVEAHQLGMVNHVVSLTELATFTLEIAREIAQKPLFALKLAKESVNAAQDAQGRSTALQLAFAHHQLCHSHNEQLFKVPYDPAFLENAGKRFARFKKE